MTATLLPPPALPPWLAADFPFERHLHRLQTGPHAGRHLHFVDHGPRDGRPAVLLLHGNPTWSFLWRQVIPLLPGRRCVAPDLLGLGLSGRLPKYRDHSLAGHAEAMVELVDALGIEEMVLVGQDWGGPVAVALAVRRPERVRALVLGNTAVVLPRRIRGSAFHRFARLPGISNFVFRALSFPQRILHRVQGDPASIRGDVARAYRWPLRHWSDRVAPLALARMVPDGPDHPSAAEMRRGEAWLRAFEGPVALVWGRRDPILGRALKRHREALPGATVTETQAGHFLQEEVPEEIAEAIEGVLQRLS